MKRGPRSACYPLTPIRVRAHDGTARTVLLGESTMLVAAAKFGSLQAATRRIRAQALAYSPGMGRNCSSYIKELLHSELVTCAPNETMAAPRLPVPG